MSHYRGAVMAAMLLSFTIAATALATDTKKLLLTIGQTKIVPLFTGQDVLVSRKGIVKLTHLNGNLFEVIALKAGVVLIQARRDAQQRLLVTVQKPTTGKRAIGNAAVCSATGVVCSSDGISGTTASLSVFLRARARCGDNCLFTLSLTDKAMQQWQNEVQKLLGQQYEVTQHGKGQLVATVFCRQQHGRRVRELADALSGGYVSRGVLRVVCMNHFDLSQYQLTAKIVMLTQAEAQQMGFNDFQQLLRLRPEQLDWQKLRNVSRIIGEPKFSLVNGTSAKFETGGEIQYAGYDKHNNTSVAWKFYGLSLQVQLDKINTTQAQLQLDFALKNPTASGNSKLNSSRFNSTVLLQVAQPKAVSVIGYHNTVVSRRTLPVLNKLPIVGPLFNNKKNERALHKIIIWLLLTYDAANTNADLLRHFHAPVSWPEAEELESDGESGEQSEPRRRGFGVGGARKRQTSPMSEANDASLSKN